MSIKGISFEWLCIRKEIERAYDSLKPLQDNHKAFQQCTRNSDQYFPKLLASYIVTTLYYTSGYAPRGL